MATLGPLVDALGGRATPTADGGFAFKGVTAEQIGDAAHQAGARIHQLVTRDATLEEAFLDATDMAEEFKGFGRAPGARR